MQLKQLGEFGLIKRIKKLIRTDRRVIKGIGDDCAVLTFKRGKYLLATCDMIVEGVDFSLKDKPYLIGRKSLAVSLSDIAACAGMPQYALISLGLPARTPLKMIDEIIKGMLDLAKSYKINIVGGDISQAQRLVIDATVLGEVEKKNLVLRSGAKIGDIILVTGSLGGSIRGKHLKFTPRLKEARFLVKNFKLNAMIDISDGLVQDLRHILEESTVGAIIYEKLIPLSRQARGSSDALYTGEDFELLFTLSRDEAKKIFKRGLNSFKPIGEIVAKQYGLKLIAKDGREKALHPRGFRHF